MIQKIKVDVCVCNCNPKIFFFFFFEKQHRNFIQREPNRFELQKLGMEKHPPLIP